MTAPGPSPLAADTWSKEQKDMCLAETAASFRYGGGLLGYLKAPPEPAAV